MLKPVQVQLDWNCFLSADYDQHVGSCIQHQVYELTDIHEQFGGFPDTYCFENTKIHQLWWTADQIDFDNLGKQLGMDVITVSSIKQDPGCMIPYHRDTFFKIRQQYPDRSDILVRANIYLEDYKLGHLIQYTHQEKTHTDVDWQQGHGWMWDSSILHLSANAGMQPKYTLQVSGFLK